MGAISERIDYARAGAETVLNLPRLAQRESFSLPKAEVFARNITKMFQETPEAAIKILLELYRPSLKLSPEDRRRYAVMEQRTRDILISTLPALQSADPKILEKYFLGHFKNQGLVRGHCPAFERRNRADTRYKKLGIDLHVPKALALDVTTRCNKEKPCKACYPEVSAKDPSFQSLEGILDGADHLGFSSVAILGGEPLVRKDLLPLLETHPDLYYFVFTNGIDLDQETVNKFKASKARTFFFVHIQGTQELTDEYMEPGDFEKQQKAMTLLNQARMPFGIVTTLDRNNIDLITNDNFLRFLGSQRQCVIAAYFHYISMGHNPKPELELTPQQKQDLKDMDSRFKRMAPPYMINPETIIGQDCVAGGYIHVNAKGAIAPCVFLEPSRDDKGMYATGESFEQAFMNSKVTKACQGIQHDQGHYGGCLRTVRRSEYLGLLDKIAI